MYTFKSNSNKSNTKRYLINSAKVENVDSYMTQVDGKWGYYVDADGKVVTLEVAIGNQEAQALTGGDDMPVTEFNTERTVPAEVVQQVAATVTELVDAGMVEEAAAVVAPEALAEAAAVVAQDPAPAPAAEEPAAAPAPSASAFGSFAMSQLTAPSNNPVHVEVPKANRENTTSTQGLKIERDRPERNGVRRQSAGSIGAKLWELYDRSGPETTLKQAREMAAQAGLNPTSAAIALYNWRKFNGITGKKD